MDYNEISCFNIYYIFSYCYFPFFQQFDIKRISSSKNKSSEENVIDLEKDPNSDEYKPKE